MSFLPICDVAKVKETSDIPKFARVVENNDPLRLGRIKVTLPGIFEGPIDSLPWIRRKMDTVFCGLNVEIFDVPEEGSIVQIQWDYDKDTPIYTGAPYNKAHTSELFTHNYPHEGGIKFGKCYIKFDKGSNNMTLSNGKTFIQCDTMGNITMTALGNLDLYSRGDLNINAINTNVQGNLNVYGDFHCSLATDGTIGPQSIASVSGGLVRTIM